MICRRSPCEWQATDYTGFHGQVGLVDFVALVRACIHSNAPLGVEIVHFATSTYAYILQGCILCVAQIAPVSDSQHNNNTACAHYKGKDPFLPFFARTVTVRERDGHICGLYA